MSRNFGLSFEKLSDRTAHGGVTPSGPRHSAGAHADSNVIKFQSPGGAAPSGHRSDSRASQPALFLPHRPALKRGPIAQALIDIFAVAPNVNARCESSSMKSPLLIRIMWQRLKLWFARLRSGRK